MKFLLPHQFKKVGVFIAPIGFAFWVSMQKGIFTRLFTYMFGESVGVNNNPPYHLANVMIAIISFFSFLAGMYFITFSKEKIEDEMVERTRLDSFQFAALIQLTNIIIGFLLMLVFREPEAEGMMLFFIGTILLFWLSFIGRFNYILHVRIK